MGACVGCFGFFFWLVVLVEYIKSQKCANYKSDADTTKPLT